MPYPERVVFNSSPVPFLNPMLRTKRAPSSPVRPWVMFQYMMLQPAWHDLLHMRHTIRAVHQVQSERSDATFSHPCPSFQLNLTLSVLPKVVSKHSMEKRDKASEASGVFSGPLNQYCKLILLSSTGSVPTTAMLTLQQHKSIKVCYLLVQMQSSRSENLPVTCALPCQEGGGGCCRGGVPFRESVGAIVVDEDHWSIPVGKANGIRF